MSTKASEVPNKELQSTSTEKTQPTNTPENQPTNNEPKEPVYDPIKHVESLERRIAEQQIQFRRMEQLIERNKEIKEQPAPKPPRNIEVERKTFYEDPIGTLDNRLDERDNRILKEMKQMLEPIREVANNFRSNNVYDNIKRDLKSDPYFGKALADSNVERMVDSIMQSGETEINIDSVKSAVAQVFGVAMMRGNVNNNNNSPRVDPPEVPSNRVRISNDEPQRQDLTEDDKIAMRYAGLKPGNPDHEKQYWNLIKDETMVLKVHNKKG